MVSRVRVRMAFLRDKQYPAETLLYPTRPRPSSLGLRPIHLKMSVKIRRERRLLIAGFLSGFYFTTSLSYPTSLCAQRSSKKCTSIACWTARFFLRKKLSKKAFYLFGLVVLPLVTAFGSQFKVILFVVQGRCVYRDGLRLVIVLTYPVQQLLEIYSIMRKLSNQQI